MKKATDRKSKQQFFRYPLQRILLQLHTYVHSVWMHKGALPSSYAASIKYACVFGLTRLCFGSILRCVHVCSNGSTTNERTKATAFRTQTAKNEPEVGKHTTATGVIDGQHITANDHMRKVYRRQRTYFLCR